MPPKPGSELSNNVIEVISAMESKAKMLEQEAKKINDKAKGKLEKIRIRLQHTESAVTGNSVFGGLVSKFKEAHKTKNKITLAKVTEYSDAGQLATAAAQTCLQQLTQIRDLGKDYPNVSDAMKNVQQKLISHQVKLAETEKAYKEARKQEKDVYDLYTKYINDKPEMKNGNEKEYEKFKTTMKEDLGKLMADDN